MTHDFSTPEYFYLKSAMNQFNPTGPNGFSQCLYNLNTIEYFDEDIILDEAEYDPNKCTINVSRSGTNVSVDYSSQVASHCVYEV